MFSLCSVCCTRRLTLICLSSSRRIAKGLYAIVKRNQQLKVFHSPLERGGAARRANGEAGGVDSVAASAHAAAPPQGTWVSAAEAVIAPSAPRAPGADDGARTLLLRVAEVLLDADVPIVWLPPRTCEALTQSGACSQVSVLLRTVTFYANLAHSLTRSPEHL